ncbi:Prefoldin beta-like protein [Neocallimastix lanati (nom. inval.)]|uniref:Prefoldin beta-like protein n=1 Tax=Neocallimastix californiae TaxID=1754190 RepID=A0A1Y2FPH5_9FUNG|nr:Prefoldin beta-like protein [Neocallimastix sp. JGI-2020a]ORY85829.1 Prefoldin beta-like protein [Neocallimastix californiae]|eukprot:ORY85829.1 Prefoldin beta-like protein [Neocallimastix californiae]
MSEQKLTDQEIVAKFQSLKQELQSISTKVGELETEKDEHELVIQTLKPLNSDRKCFRLIHGVLVERTIKDVLPAVENNLVGINAIISQLVQTYKKKEEELLDFQKKYKIVVKSV